MGSIGIYLRHFKEQRRRKMIEKLDMPLEFMVNEIIPEKLPGYIGNIRYSLYGFIIHIVHISVH